MDDLLDMEAHLELLERKSRITEQETKELRKLLDMPFHRRLQQPSQVLQLERFEKAQKETFFNLIKKRDELNHLKAQQDELFAEFFIDWLKGKLISINEFFYEDRLAPVGKRVLKKKFLKS